MQRRSWTTVAVSCFALVATFADHRLCRADGPLLEPDVLPIFTKHCMGCHGGLKQEGQLDLRTIPAMLKGGETGPAIVSSELEKSELWKKIAADEMPDSEEKLSSEEKEVVKRWIENGLPTLVEVQHTLDDPLLSAGTKHPPREVAETIDKHIGAFLQSTKLQPAPLTDDAEFLRRTYLDLTGRVPTARQASEFLDSSDTDKRAALIDALLETPEFGEQFGRTWRDWVCPPELPSDMNGGKQPHQEAHDFGKWLGQRIAENDPWDKIVREILTVEGEIKQQPHVIFYGLVGQDGKVTPDGSARAVASLFMGVQLQCSQCHDDPYRDWAQDDHWALAAFFGNTSGDFKKVTESIDKKTAQIKIPDSAFKNTGKIVPAAFLGSGPVGSQNSVGRDQLADWLTAKDNPFFGRSFANRLWFYFFSRGLVNPVDDMRALNPPSHPGLIRLLGNEFVDSAFDVKHLVRCVCNSQAYQRTSRSSGAANDETVASLTNSFGRMPLRVMTADMLYDSLKLAYGDPKLDLRAIDPKDGNSSGESAPVGDLYVEFLRRFETNEEDATDFTHGIPQMLTMINHPRLLGPSGALTEFLKSHADAPTEQTITWLYLSTLSRRPASEELAEALEYVEATEDQHEAYVGLLWTLVNRSEFLFVR